MRRALPLLLLSLAIPACHGLENVGVGNAAPGSPPPKKSSFDDPVVVTRDNPWLGGGFLWYGGESSTASGDFATDGAWTGLTDAQVVLREYKRTGAPFGYGHARMLPRPGEQEGPGLAVWSTRTGRLVHDNVFLAGQSHVHTASGLTHASSHPLSLALSRDVALVPVVLIAWRTGDEPEAELERVLAVGRAMFDFEPLVPLGSPLPLKASVASPDEFNKPPDDVWSQCAIQFQIVAEAVLDVPQPWPGPDYCSPDPPDVNFANAAWRDARLREALGDAEADRLAALAPFYVGYGFYQCATFVGKAPSSAFVEISSDTGDKYENVTAHELGHLFFGAGHAYPAGNLMADGALGGTTLTKPQCDEARSKALAASARYAAYNQAIGRAAPPALIEAPVGKPVPPSEVCCQIENVAGSVPAPLCAILNGKVVPKSACEPPKACCVVGTDPPEAAFVLASQCAPASMLPDAQCDNVCCDVDGVVLQGLTRYACTTQDHPIVTCPKRVK